MNEKFILTKLSELEMKIFELENKIAELEKKSFLNNNDSIQTDKPSKDYTSYKFNDNTYKKSRLVLAVVKQYVKDHKGITAIELAKAFPNKFGLVGRYECTKKLDSLKNDNNKLKDPEKRYFCKDDEVIRLDNGEVVVVCTQWDKKMIDLFIEFVKDNYGYEIEEIAYNN